MEAVAFGVMHVDENRRVTGFVEKPADPPAMPGQPDMALASMGIYVFNAEYLYPAARREHRERRIPITTSARTSSRASSTQGRRSRIRSACRASRRKPIRTREPYWRDVGTIDAYWAANLDLASTIPKLDLYDRNWPIWTYQEQLPPAKFVRDLNGRRARAII